MPATKTPTRQRKVSKVIHAFKDGDLHSSSGQKVTKRKQAVAIALHEAGISRDQTSKDKSKR